MEPEEFTAIGVYDPHDPNAELRLELLQYVTALGATTDELVTFRDTLPALAGVLSVRGGPALTLEEAAARSGLSTLEVRALAQAAGIPDPEPEVPEFTEGFVEFISNMSEFANVFGEDASTQLLRVFGLAMSRIADAVISSFLVNVAPAAQREDPVGLGVARANVEAASLLRIFGPALDALFRQHLLIARRLTNLDEQLVGIERRSLVVGFVDLVGSTELGENLDLSELGMALGEFERTTTETITEGGGRVVKLIGDEIMYTAPDAVSAASIALDLADAFDGHISIPQVRVGLASGEVLLRDGDVFRDRSSTRPAAPASWATASGEVVTTSDVAAAAGLPHVSLGTHHLNGIPGQVELHQLIRS